MNLVSAGEIEPPLVVALDLGSSSVRGFLYDRLGRAVEAVQPRLTYSMRLTADGGVEGDADELCRLVERCLDEVLEQARSRTDSIAGVAFSTFWHSLLGVDANHVPQTTVYTWADTRSQAAADALRRRLDASQVHARTGCVLHASYWPAKLLWLRDTQPETVGAVSRWMSFGEYLFLRWFGQPACSPSMASATGLFDQREDSWDSELLQVLGLQAEQFSPARDLDRPYRGLRKDLADRWPALHKVPWFPPLGDGGCSNIGSGCLTPHQWSLTLGTSAALRALWLADWIEVPAGLWRYRVDRHRFVLGGALSNAGNLFAWLQRTLRLGDHQLLERQVAAMEPDAHGLTVLPFWAGERSPSWNLRARGAIVGLTLHTTATEIVRATLEAIAYRIAAVAEQLHQTVTHAPEIIASGGALSGTSPWVQILTDVLGCPVILSGVSESASRGAALLALEALGAIKGPGEVPVPAGKSYLPDARRHQRYREAAERQRVLLARLFDPPPQS
ncbi:MAG: gluconokinase [Terriglobia bacterium]